MTAAQRVNIDVENASHVISRTVYVDHMKQIASRNVCVLMTISEKSITMKFLVKLWKMLKCERRKVQCPS
jgi:hypothetical protein